MTVINIIRQRDSIHLFTDTKANLNGLPAGQLVKCLPVPHLSCAVATRGESLALQAIHRLCSQYASYVEMKRMLIADLRKLARLHPVEAERQALNQQWDMFVIGWGEAGPEAFGIFNHDLHGIPAFTIYEVPGIVITPVVPHEILDDVMATENYISIALLLMETQRRIYPDIVGGHLIETWVDVDGIHTRSLKPFADIAFRPAATTREVKLPAAFARYQTEGVR